ncbi:MAG: ABC transporter substrate-binding protein, partial [Planctomycetales bacterium]
EVKEVVEQIKKVHPDLILNTINGDTNTAFFRALRSAGITPQQIPTLSFSIGEAELGRLDVEKMVGDYAAWNYFQSIDSPTNKAFVKKFKDKDSLSVLTDPMESAYSGVKLWAQAVEQAGNINPGDIRRAIRTERLEGPGGLVRVDAATQHTYKTPRIGRVRSDGQFDIVWTAAKPYKPEPYPETRTAEQWRAVLHDLYQGWGKRWSAPPK